MAEIKLFIATTLDGFIARNDGSLDWLQEYENAEGEDYGYREFLGEIDTLVMGRISYEQVLAFGTEWPYTGQKTLVVTSNRKYKLQTPDTFLLSSISKGRISEIRKNSRKHIWLVGGGKLVTEFLNHNAIDEMTLSVIPRILGKGIALFPGAPKETLFRLVKVQSYTSGLVNLCYRRNP